jgi:hypothetical protein
MINRRSGSLLKFHGSRRKFPKVYMDIRAHIGVRAEGVIRRSCRAEGAPARCTKPAWLNNDSTEIARQ